MLRTTFTWAGVKSERSDGAALSDENKKSCNAVSFTGRKLGDNHRSDLVDGDSESQPNMGKFMEVVKKALNKQPSSQGVEEKRKADLFKAMETPVTRKPPISEGEKSGKNWLDWLRKN